MVYQGSFSVATPGRGSLLISDQVHACVRDSGLAAGMVLVFVHHTSASLILCENADPQVRADLERFMARLVPDGDPLFRHTGQGVLLELG